VGAVSASALTGSINYTNLTNVPTLVSGSEQIVSILSSLNSFTASNSTTNTFTSSASARLNSIETKIEKYRVKTPEEKLELRTLDSGPFNQKLSQFFEDKEEEMEMTGKNEYVLTPDEVESYSPNEIKRSFRNFEDIADPDSFNNSGYQKIY
jgi:hypothetical protein